MEQKTAIDPQDLIPLEEYQSQRGKRRREIMEHKRPRRVDVGPVATAYFEDYLTMLHQVQEMLYVEKGGEEQLREELHAYNPLIPKGRDLCCTLMFEIDQKQRRTDFLATLGGVENTLYLQFAGQKIVAVPEQDVERSTPGGKASSVHFLHFHFTPAQVAAFRSADTVTMGFDHPQYPHATTLPPPTHTALQRDFH